MDGPTKREQRDRSGINMHERYEVKYWTHRLGISRERLRQGRQFSRDDTHGAGTRLTPPYKAAPGGSGRRWRIKQTIQIPSPASG